MTEAKTRRPWIARSVNSLGGAAMFVAPLLALVAVWAIVLPLFQVNPRVFPSVGSVGAPALESIRDGTLIAFDDLAAGWRRATNGHDVLVLDKRTHARQIAALRRDGLHAVWADQHLAVLARG